MDRHSEKIRAVKDGVRHVITATVTAHGGRFYVNGKVEKRKRALWKFWIGPDVQTLTMGPYETFDEAREHLVQVMKNHADNLRGGLFFDHKTFKFRDTDEA